MSIKITIVGEYNTCELCGKQAELRPYGPNGESICFDCGMKNEVAAKKKFSEIQDGADIVIVSHHKGEESSVNN